MIYSPAEVEQYQSTIKILDTAMPYSPAEQDNYKVSIGILDIKMEQKTQ